MKALKATATTILAVLLLVCGMAAQTVALVKYTLLNPAFFDTGEKSAYDLIGQVVVRKISDGVMQNAPPIALRTLDREQAYALVSQALPPGKVAGMLQTTAPAVDRFLFSGGDIPVLTGSPELKTDEEAAVKSLLMPEVWTLAQTGSAFPVLPFTPEWNQSYGSELTKSLWLPRYYAGFSGQALWLAIAGVVLMAGLLYLTWLKERRPFFNTVGTMLTLNGLIVIAPALAISFYSQDLAKALAAWPALSGMASFFGDSFAELFRAVFWPFREISFIAALTSLALGVTMFAAGLSNEQDALKLKEKPWLLPRAVREKTGENLLGVKKPRHARP